ncbi:hypothetical protein HOD29_03435 [archaeon]|jgi:large subunit ribosomal protein L31e|nr:hypothetical protein [archaeon]
MAEKTKTTKVEKIEREYTIPLREKCRPVPRYKKTPKAVKTVKEFLVRHMKIRDRDLKKIKIDQYLNEQLWVRGIKKPLHKVKVKVVKEGDIVRVYATDLPKKIHFKKLRVDKREKTAADIAEKKKSVMEKAKESIQGGGAKKEDKSEKEVIPKADEKEKQEAVKETGEKIEKEKAKEVKHSTKTKETGEPKERVSEK